MVDVALQELWVSFTQTERINITERQKRLADFLDLLLCASETGTSLSNLVHFCDICSVVSLLGGQLLVDVEQICLGTVDYNDDSVESFKCECPLAVEKQEVPISDINFIPKTCDKTCGSRKDECLVASIQTVNEVKSVDYIAVVMANPHKLDFPSVPLKPSFTLGLSSSFSAAASQENSFGNFMSVGRTDAVAETVSKDCICNDDDTFNEKSDDLKSKRLKRYLLQGCGAKIIVALDHLGVFGLTGSCEISRVLSSITLFLVRGHLSNCNVVGSSNEEFNQIQDECHYSYAPTAIPSLTEIFSTYEDIKKLKRKSFSLSVSGKARRRASGSSRFSRQNSMTGSTIRVHNRQHRLNRRYSVAAVSSKKLQQSDSDDEPTDLAPYFARWKQRNFGTTGISVQFHRNPRDFDYYTNVIRSGDEGATEGGSDSWPREPALSLPKPSQQFRLSLNKLLAHLVSIQFQISVHELSLNHHQSKPLPANAEILEFSLQLLSLSVSANSEISLNCQLDGLTDHALRLVCASAQRCLRSCMLSSLVELNWLDTLLKCAENLFEFVLLHSAYTFAVENVCQSDSMRNNVVDCDSDESVMKNLMDHSEKIEKCKDLKVIGEECYEACSNVLGDLLVGVINLLQVSIGSSVISDSNLCFQFLWTFVTGWSQVVTQFLELNFLHKRLKSTVISAIGSLILCVRNCQNVVSGDNENYQCDHVISEAHHSAVFEMKNVRLSDSKAKFPSGDCRVIQQKSDDCLIARLVTIIMNCFATTNDSFLKTLAQRKLFECRLCCCMSVAQLLTPFLSPGNKCLLPCAMSFMENVVWKDLNGTWESGHGGCSICNRLDFECDSHLLTSCEGLQKTADIEAREASHWFGISLYIEALHRDVTAKTAKHVTQLYIHSNQPVRLVMCRTVIFPMADKIYYSTGRFPGCKIGVLKMVCRCLKLALLDFAELAGDFHIVFVTHVCRIIEHCRGNQETRQEALHLLCSAAVQDLVEIGGENKFLEDLHSLLVTSHSFWVNYFINKSNEARQTLFQEESSAFHETFSTNDIIDKTLFHDFVALTELWIAVNEAVSQSSQLKDYLVDCCLSTLAGTLLVHVTQDLARHLSPISQTYLLTNEEFSVTCLLMKSLLLQVVGSFKKDRIDSILSDFSVQLLQCSFTSCCRLKQLVTVLLHCCVVVSFGLNSATEQLWLPEPSNDDMEEVTSSDESSGYEADSEQRVRARSHSGNSAYSGPNKQNVQIPELILLALKLVVSHHENFFESRETDIMEGIENDVNTSDHVQRKKLCDDETSHASSITQCLHSILLLCRGSPTACRDLQSFGFLHELLRSFSSLIEANDDIYQDLNRTVLTIWAEIGRISLSAHELAQVLQLFKAPSPPTELLLYALSRIWEVSGKEPEFRVSYSVTSSHIDHPIYCNFDMAPEILSASLASFVNVVVPAPSQEAVSRIRESHRTAKVNSCVSSACLSCLIPRSFHWSLYASGVSASTWMCVKSIYRRRRLDKSSRTPDASSTEIGWNLRHILAVGTQHLMFSVWVEPDRDAVHVFLTREVESSCTVLAHGVMLHSHVSDGMWHHVGLSIPPVHVRKGGIYKIVLIVDAVACCSLSLVVPPMGGVKKSSPVYLLLGCTSDDKLSALVSDPVKSLPPSLRPLCRGEEISSTLVSSHPFVYAANTLLFREPILSRELCLYLMSLGGNCTALLPLAGGQDGRVLLAPWLGPRLVTAGLDPVVFYGRSQSLLRPAQESLLVLHCASNPNEYIMFSSPEPSLQDNGVYYPVCVKHKVVAFCELKPSRRFSPETALLALGGTVHFIYLWARVLEVSRNERDHSHVLSLLLGAVTSSPLLAAQFASLGGGSLLGRTLASPAAIPGVMVLKAALDNCIKPSVIQYLACRDIYQVVSHVPAVLVDRILLESLLVHWSALLRDEPVVTKCCLDDEGLPLGILGLLLTAIKVLLMEGQPYCAFNLAQLHDIQALDKILMICKDLKLTNGWLKSQTSPTQFTDVIRGLVIGSCRSGHGIGKQLNMNTSCDVCFGGANLASSDTNVANMQPSDIQFLLSFLLFAHPAPRTFAESSPPVAYYLTATEADLSVSVGVDIVAELRAREKKENMWVVIDGDNGHDMTFTETFIGVEKTDIDDVTSLVIDKANSGNVVVQKKVDINSVEDMHLKIPKETELNNSPKDAEYSCSYSRDIFGSLASFGSSSNGEESDCMSGLSTDAGETQLPQCSLVSTEDNLAILTAFTSAGNNSTDNLKQFGIAKFDSKTEFDNEINKELLIPNLYDKLDTTPDDTVRSFLITPETQCENQTERSPKLDELFSCPSVEISPDTEISAGIVVGILSLVAEAFDASTEVLTACLEAQVLSFDVLAVLANQPRLDVRSAVLKLISVVWRQMPVEEYRLQERQRTLVVLSHQLFMYPEISEELLENAFSLAFGQRFDFREGLTEKHVENLSVEMVSRFVPLFAIVPKTATNVSLGHNTLSTLLQLLQKKPSIIARLVTDSHVVESLMLTLRGALHEAGLGVVDSTGESMGILLVEDVTDILVSLVDAMVVSKNGQDWEICLDVIHLVQMTCKKELAQCGGQSICVGHIRGVQGSLILAALASMKHASMLWYGLGSFRPSCRTTENIAATSTINFGGVQSIGVNSNNEKLTAPNDSNCRQSSLEILECFVQQQNKTFVPLSFSFSRNFRDKNETEMADSGLGWTSNDVFSNGCVSGAFPQSISAPADLHDIRCQVSGLPELADRFRTLLQRATDLVFLSAHCCSESSTNENVSITVERYRLFCLSYLELLLASILTKKKVPSDRSGYERMLATCQEVICLHLSHFLVLTMAPDTPSITLMEAMSLLSGESRLPMVLFCLARSHGQMLYKLGVFIHQLRYGNTICLTANCLQQCDQLLKMLKHCNINIFSPPEAGISEWQTFNEQGKDWRQETTRIATSVLNRYMKFDRRLTTRTVPLYESVVIQCDRITRGVVDRQNVERKVALGLAKRAKCLQMDLTHRWQCLILALTHERAIWYTAGASPKSWQLEPTEGPCRVRKRLMRESLRLPCRYLMPEYANKLDPSPFPLDSLFTGSRNESSASTMIERLNLNEQIVLSINATFVSPGTEFQGELLMGHSTVYFIGETSDDLQNRQFATKDTEKETVSLTWHHESVGEILPRRYQLQDCALEIFLTTGCTVFLAFQNQVGRDQVITTFLSCGLPNLSSRRRLPEMTSLWKEGRMTNFEYLMQLNTLAGRSFNDLMQYPVFPFVLNNYTADILNLNDGSVYRNMKKPIAIQNADMEPHYVNNYEMTSQFCRSEGGGTDGPYHFCSLYSNSGIVLHFLVRLPPFTQLFLRYQDGHFDIPDRTFHSMQTTWRLASRDSTTDFKELIPEFFFLPEMFLNAEGFNLGVRQSGEGVHHVRLPTWASDDPRRFVLIHRAALESPFVTSQLHHWIDLIFGYKQSGRAAVEAINVFHPATYFGYDVDKSQDRITQDARRTMIKTYGQVPQQLFMCPHPHACQPAVPGHEKQAPEVLHEVRGLRWGIYAGSPADDRPTLALVQTLKNPVTSLTEVTPGQVVLLPEQTLVASANDSSKNPHIVSWHHADGVVRVRQLQKGRLWPLVPSPMHDTVTFCTCGHGKLWLGFMSGQILAYAFKTSLIGDDLSVSHPPSLLHAHTNPVMHMCVSVAFGVCVSGSKDGVCAIWDADRLSYIRCVGSGTEVSLIAISETLGDWVSVSTQGSVERPCSSPISVDSPTSPQYGSPQGGFSVLRLYTLNGALVEWAETLSPVTAATFSAVAEGTSVNVLATALANGTIRLWSSWDLRPVGDLKTDRAQQPMTSLMYTSDNYHLCGVTQSGLLVVWETSLAKCKLPKFISVTS